MFNLSASTLLKPEWSLVEFKPLQKLRTALVTKKIGVTITAFLISIFTAQSVWAIPSQVPLFLTNPIVPIMMLNLSKDHQLYFKAYDDYSDITDSNKLDGSGNPNPNYGGAPDGVADTTYVNGYDYYGYFDSSKCYKYSTSNTRFEPSGTSAAHYCNQGASTGEWSGNFLNWASMTRMDVIRKILYGGFRSTDSSSDTTLERSFIPADAHAFAKYYDGNDINKLTPFNPPALQLATAATGITLCNVTVATSGYSQSITSPPLLRVAKGNYQFWASNERWQCRWASEKSQTLDATSGSNGNTFTSSGSYAYNDNPVAANKLLEAGVSAAGLSEYYVRVKACVAPLSTAESPAGQYGECYAYPSGAVKPVGLLQEFGETNQIYFGLMTGSFGKNKSGGVLRKNVGNMLDEINATTDGTFKSQPSTGGIVATLNALRVFGYDYTNGYYNNSSPGDNCSWGANSFTDGKCTNWGNPQSEIYLESLRYLYGASGASSTFASTDSSNYISTLKNPTWVKPVTNTNYCAPLNVLQFNGSSSTYDIIDSSNSYNTATDIGMTGGANDVKTWTDKVGTKNGISSGSWFFGRLLPATTGTLADGLCTAKTVDNLSNVSGTCTDAPRLEGSYHIAGLAYYARNKGAPAAGVTKVATKTVRTYGVALAPSVPKVEVSVPGSRKTVVIQPACQNTSINGNCAIVDFKILTQQVGVTLAATGDSSVDGTLGNQGRLYVNWEDSEQGGDYDQDMWGIIDYAVNATKVVVKTKVVAQSTGDKMGFGYVISGTDNDGYKVQSGIDGYTYGTSCTTTAGSKCTCRVSGTFGACDSPESIARAVTYNIGATAANSYKPPLYYAAKWGGYSDDFAKKSTNLDADLLARDPTGESYYYATNPRELKDNLAKTFADIAADVGSASAVATNSTHLSEGTFVYQAQFNSTNWTGTLNSFEFDNNGNLPTLPTYTTDNTMPKTGAGRTIYTYDGSNLVNFSWGTLTAAQRLALRLGSESDDVNAQKRADWLVGNATYETVAGGLRSRGLGIDRNILGDIVNSSPAYVGAKNRWFDSLPGAAGSTYPDYVDAKATKPARIFVGGNDGMLHAFDANNLTELFAYIPNLAYPKLANITGTDYGKNSNPHKYVVDGPITVGDVYINNGSGTTEWRTIIVGTMGAGAPGVYALDVTDPVPRVLFEISQANYPSIGYVMGKPIIAPMKNGRWAAIFGNGDSSTKTSQLFVVDIEAPFSSHTRILDTGTGTGLSAPAGLPDYVGRVTTVYAGDINGNMWRFDLSDASESNWKKDLLLFVAKDNSSNPQAITAPPTLGSNALKDDDLMVYFGTGKYYDTSDNSVGTTVHSFYAIADINSTVSKSSLKQKTFSSTYGATPTRTVVDTNPTWSSQNGWYMDFSETVGERVTTQAILLTDKLIFPTLTPSSIACQYGGYSWLMELVAVGNKYIGQHILPGGDETTPPPPIYGTFLVLGDPGIGIVSADSSSGGTTCEASGGHDARIIYSGSSGDLVHQNGTVPCKALGRQSWRQIR